MDDILRHPGESYTVEYFKKKYDLSNDEYNMIFELTMPLIREINIKRYWAAKYSSLIRRIRELCLSKKITKTDLVEKLKQAIEPSAGEDHMMEAMDMEEETEEMEDYDD
jgi:hypothetical protein